MYHHRFKKIKQPQILKDNENERIIISDDVCFNKKCVDFIPLCKPIINLSNNNGFAPLLFELRGAKQTNKQILRI